MTTAIAELVLYGISIFFLFAIPGPVWIAVIARALVGGVVAAVPVAAAVAVGDITWALLAIWSMSWVGTSMGEAFGFLTWGAAVAFIVMGVMTIRHAGDPIGEDQRLSRPGIAAGFAMGLLVIFANPKAVFFYMIILPGFFDLVRIGWLDIVAILAISAAVPFISNLLLALLVARVHALIGNPVWRARLNRVSGTLLIALGCVLALV